MVLLLEVQDIIAHTRRPSIQISHPGPPPSWTLSPNRQGKTKTHNTRRSVRPTSWRRSSCTPESSWASTGFLLGERQWTASSVMHRQLYRGGIRGAEINFVPRPNHAYLRCDADGFDWILAAPAGGASLSPRPRLRSGSCTTAMKPEKESRPPRICCLHDLLSVAWAAAHTGFRIGQPKPPARPRRMQDDNNCRPYITTGASRDF